ncbi:MAG: sterol desaturase/sphingolipid hydroxylase (fatty acid hydroxylase superfamily) [Paracoccaceae bacterium]|jgi:sterol desaturase/sphingolipid hydroxylase (fatty acid hydroxylase superfamily)
MFETVWTLATDAIYKLAILGAFFALAGLMFRRPGRSDRRRRKWPEVRLNLAYYGIDVAAITPVMALLAATIATFSPNLVSPAVYGDWPGWAVLLFAVVVSDFVGYGRHRLMHIRALWPFHAIHHSDTEMTWLTLARFHPVNRLITTICNALVLTLLGLPPWAVVVNALFRHFYGYFIHADLPLGYGPLRRLLVSPELHRWHHARDVTGSGKNFGAVFAIWDIAFGTWYMPKERPPALGVSEDGFPQDWLGQTLWPFRTGWPFRAGPGRNTGLAAPGYSTWLSRRRNLLAFLGVCLGVSTAYYAGLHYSAAAAVFTS